MRMKSFRVYGQASFTQETKKFGRFMALAKP